MSLSGIISGACAVLTGTSAFDDNNLSWMDPGIIDTSPCRWAATLTLESADPTRMVYSSATDYSHVWRLTMLCWVKYNVSTFSTWQADNKTMPQDVIDAISTCDTLSGSCDDASIALTAVESVESGGQRFAFYTWTIEAEEYSK